MASEIGANKQTCEMAVGLMQCDTRGVTVTR